MSEALSRLMRVVAVMTVEPPPALDATEAPDRIDLASHLPEIPTFSAGPLGTGSVEFSALSLRGLDHFENTSAALVDARSVRVAARLPSLKAHAALKLTLTPIPAEEPSEGCNGCAWIAEHKCPFDYESDAQNEATDDGTACYRFCCQVPPLVQELVADVEIRDTYVEALFAISPDEAAMEAISLARLAERPECALAVIGFEPRHLALRLSPGDVEIGYAYPHTADGDGTLGAAALATAGYAVQLYAGASLPGAIADAIDAALGGPGLNMLASAIAGVNLDGCGAGVAPRGFSGAWANLPDRTSMLEGAAAADNETAAEHAARANLAMRTLGIDSISLPGELVSLVVTAPLAEPTPIEIGVSDVCVSGLASLSEVSLLLASRAGPSLNGEDMVYPIYSRKLIFGVAERLVADGFVPPAWKYAPLSRGPSTPTGRSRRLALGAPPEKNLFTTSDFSQNLNAIVPEHLVPKMLSSTLLVTSAGMTIGALEPLRASVAVRVSLLGARLRILPGLPLASSCKTTLLSSFR